MKSSEPCSSLERPTTGDEGRDLGSSVVRPGIKLNPMGIELEFPVPPLANRESVSFVFRTMRGQKTSYSLNKKRNKVGPIFAVTRKKTRHKPEVGG